MRMVTDDGITKEISWTSTKIKLALYNFLSKNGHSKYTIEELKKQVPELVHCHDIRKLIGQMSKMSLVKVGDSSGKVVLWV